MSGCLSARLCAASFGQQEGFAAGLGEGADAQAPLARAVIGGLTASTLVTLVLIPVMYAEFYRVAEAKARHTINFQTAEQIRYRERTAAERVNARLKDEFGGRCVRVRGHAKVACHLMFGILALAVDQLMRLLGG